MSQPKALSPEQLQLLQAKNRLLVAAAQIDPFATMRKRPWTTVGIAAGAGVILAVASPGARWAGPLINSLSSALRPVLFSAGQSVATWAMNRSAAKNPAAEESAPQPPPLDPTRL